MPTLLNRAEAPLPAAFQPSAPKSQASQRSAEISSTPEKKAALSVSAPNGSIAAIESRLGF